MIRLLAHSFLFLAASAALALAANALRPGGLELGRQYFHQVDQAAPAAQGTGTAEQGNAPAASPAARYNLQALSLAEVHDYWQVRNEAPGDDTGVYFLDARHEKNFKSGHVPGATLCYYYQSADYLTEDLLAKLREAIAVIVYCNGGDCEDSIHLSLDLIQKHRVPSEAVFVFEGGMEEWRKAGHPVAQE